MSRVLSVILGIILLGIGFLAGQYIAPSSFRSSQPIGPAPVKDYQSVHYLNRVSQFSALLEPADLVMLGDSITEFGEWHELLPDFSVINRGISGDLLPLNALAFG